jgi:copper resistance protein C
VDSDPRDGATLSSPPSAITLTFSEPVQTSFTQVAVLDSAGGRYESGQPQIDGARVIQPVTPLRNGSFQISYRVVSADGHPVTGTLSFAVAAPVADSPAPTSAGVSAPAAPGVEASASASPAPGDRSAAADSANSPERVNIAEANANSQAIPTWALVSAGVVVVAALSAGAVLLARRRVQPIDNGGTRHTERENVYKER